MRIDPFMHWFWPRSTALFRRLERLINRWRFALFECSTLKSVHIGPRCTFNSPVRVADGAGILQIGDNSVLGAMSVVTRPILSNCVASGVPARVIRTIS